MKDKTQYEALMEELQKIVENFRVGVAEIGEIFSKLLPDIEITEGEEDTWEMKCPYECGDTHYCIQPNGAVFADCWEGIESDNRYFSQGNVFPTEEAAELEAERRNLLTRFRSFRDECNGDWEKDWKSHRNRKYFISFETTGKLILFNSGTINQFCLFGYFKNEQDAQRAIDLFGDEIKELFVDCEG
jgi:hypothetical protein|nr:MAG TPA: hypothetical protein [Caudoviricetes sp.]